MHKPKSKPKSKPNPGFGSRFKTHSQPIMMVQVFDEPPYVLAKGDLSRLPNAGKTHEFLDKVQELVRDLIEPTNSVQPAEVRVSGVPYTVPAETIQPKSEESDHG